jgi:RNA polymerase sigma factor (TIGR02999 family)
MVGMDDSTKHPGDEEFASRVTHVLRQVSSGDQVAVGDLLPLVYDQLRALAQQRMMQERPGHTLQATALVHEAFLKLVGPREIPWAGQAHFYAAAAEAMRRILVDHARTRQREHAFSSMCWIWPTRRIPKKFWRSMKPFVA